ncbi:MAG: methyltransferase domain-containing protein [Pseudomonadota bacterium]
MGNGFLSDVYDARDANATRELYDAWSKTYEAELAENGYATPGRCAEALAGHTSDLTAPVLDFGCGTGLSGLALRLAGFETIDGLDLSAEMLEQARSKGIYRNLDMIDADAQLHHAPGDYAAIAAIGVIGAGAAPVSVFHRLVRSLETGGKLVFSFNDHTLQEPIFEAAVCEWLDCGAVTLLFKEHGPHVPGIDLKANVYVIEKK